MQEACPLCQLVPGREVRSAPTAHPSCTNAQHEEASSLERLHAAKSVNHHASTSQSCAVLWSDGPTRHQSSSKCKADPQGIRTHARLSGLAAFCAAGVASERTVGGRCARSSLGDPSNASQYRLTHPPPTAWMVDTAWQAGEASCRTRTGQRRNGCGCRDHAPCVFVRTRCQQAEHPSVC